MSYADSPIPNNPGAQFANWKRTVDEQIRRLLYRKSSVTILSITGTTDSGGLLTFTHDIGEIPTGVFIQVHDPSPSNVWCTIVDSLTTITARARFLTVSGGSVISYATSSVTFFAYIAVM